MTYNIETQLLDALELFHYSEQFRDSVFVLVLAPDISVEPLLGDLKLLQSARISSLLVCQNSEGLESSLKRLSERGVSFGCRFFTNAAEIKTDERKSIRSALQPPSQQSQEIPVLIYGGGENNTLCICREAVNLAKMFEADKLFYLSAARGLTVDNSLQSFLSAFEVEKLLHSGQEIGFDSNTLSLFLQANKEQGLEIVILDGEPGSLFQEIFTHRGRGTLISEDYPNIIRQAKLSDVFEISRLLKPSIEQGSILPVNDDEIASNIERYYVYTVNGAIVAAAQLADYGRAAAMAKFCTLARYQGKGRARELGSHLMEKARAEGKDYIFAVSTSARMWAFLSKLGFSEIPREELPQAWKEGYDFSRQSRAFAIFFDSPPRKKKTRVRKAV